ncbi:MAG: ribonuclease H-like domain-containing protein [Anaerolineaceae bacterium]|nr:ribonuclease H-like domain-containing protein [Anaerolineaceae bacterium]
MNSEYKKKLESLGVYFGSKDSIEFKSINKKKTKKLSGTININSLGEYFYAEHEYHSIYIHGSVPFNHFFPPHSVYSTPETDSSFELNKCLFLDTETTGLSTSGGTFAFMVGIGWFEENHFTIRQYFLISPDQEEAMLLDLENKLAKHQNIVTYNGIGFDIPILKARFKYHRIPTTIVNIKQIDLLKYARMLFRYQFDNRSLKSIESKVLNFTRSEEEIPGYLAPIIYQDYLKTGELQDITGVFYHNEMDVISLAALLKIIDEVSHEIDIHFSAYETLHYSLARQFERTREYSKAIDYYSKALKQPKLPDSIRRNCYLCLANIYKKSNQIDKAMVFWEYASEFGSTESSIEIAKIFEHKIKNYELALDYCKKALLLLENDVNSMKRAVLKDQIEYRIERLKAKKKL